MNYFNEEELKQKEEQALLFLERLLQENQFEMWRTDDMEEGSWKVTYMFNDAVESYLLLEHVVQTGEYSREQENTELRLITEENRYGVVGKQASGNCFVVWFSSIQFICQLYAYHEIGHFWVKGAEHLRQLIYEIGLMEDKMEYLGEAFCTKEEIALLDLLEFAPFRAYYSVPWEKDEEFIVTDKGIKAFRKIIEEVHRYETENKKEITCQRKMEKFLAKYEKNPTISLRKKMSKCLNKAGFEAYYLLLREKVMEASSAYPPRSFGKEMDQWVEEKRKELEEQWKAEGWNGVYPDYEKIEGKKHLRMHVVEELPFTTEEMRYRFHGMVSVCGKREWKKLGRKEIAVNVGFFEGRGKGEIRSWEVWRGEDSE